MTLALAVVAALVGLLRRQARRYWVHAAGAVAVQVLVLFLGAGGGTLEDPSGDGLITREVRRATDDGPAMAAFGLAVIALGWGIPLWLLRRGYRLPPHRPSERKRPGPSLRVDP